MGKLPQKPNASGFASKRPEYKPPSTADKLADVGGALTEVAKPWIKLLLLGFLVFAVFSGGFLIYNAVYPAKRPNAQSTGNAIDPVAQQQQAKTTRAAVRDLLTKHRFDDAWRTLQSVPTNHLASDDRRSINKLILDAVSEARRPFVDQAESARAHGDWKQARERLDAARAVAKAGLPDVGIEQLAARINQSEQKQLITDAESALAKKELQAAIDLIGRSLQIPCADASAAKSAATHVRETVQGRLNIESNADKPHARSNGTEVSAAPNGELYGLPSGNAVIEVSAAGFLPKTVPVFMKPYPQTTELRVQLTPEAPGPAWALFVLRGSNAQVVAEAYYKRHAAAALSAAFLERVMQLPPNSRRAKATTVERVLADFDNKQKKSGILEALEWLGSRTRRDRAIEDGVHKQRDEIIAEALARIEHGCAACLGEGSKKCDACKNRPAKEKRKCPDCDQGFKKCDRCKGKKQERCRFCDHGFTTQQLNSGGRFTQPQSVPCTKCSRGLIPCTNFCCKNGRVKCRKCNGEGTRSIRGPCSKCDGKGEIDCLMCDGSGDRDHMESAKREEKEKEVETMLDTR